MNETTVTNLNQQYSTEPSKPEPTGNRRKFSSKQLFAAQNEIVIEHMGEEYRLRITSNGKLILTK
ncbi:hemin transporter HemP [Methylomonas lenta]|uniref:Hemin transporter HemP n=1 Tax=Methylomonas lenta TaxID=980561 RepID=A0A177NL67_9GAMM|nr:hemin uptake protein HemP [Methylomonas lenta]MDD2737507.1 hemin uptake protein HemP [Methylomonas lenta]OAI18757.1 hemin transporter HemP [Methylomonas lenta]